MRIVDPDTAWEESKRGQGEERCLAHGYIVCEPCATAAAEAKWEYQKALFMALLVAAEDVAIESRGRDLSPSGAAVSRLDDAIDAVRQEVIAVCCEPAGYDPCDGDYPACTWTGQVGELKRDSAGVTHCPLCDSCAITERIR